MSLVVVVAVELVVLNFVLIPKWGLIGVGIATFSANFLYFLLSAIVVLPDFQLKVPKNTLLRSLIAILPTAFFSYAYKLGYIPIPGAVQFLLTIAVFYGLYTITKLFIYKPAD